MNDFSSLLQQGNAWLFVPSAILLGALHGLEPAETGCVAWVVRNAVSYGGRLDHCDGGIMVWSGMGRRYI